MCTDSDMAVHDCTGQHHKLLNHPMPVKDQLHLYRQQYKCCWRGPLLGYLQVHQRQLPLRVSAAHKSPAAAALLLQKYLL